MTRKSSPTANPRRRAAGRRNRDKRGALSDDGRARLRAAALHGQPWLLATGPRTLAGKARSAANGRVRQRGPLSARQLRAEITKLRQELQAMADLCHSANT
jgi:hypothetical protein